MATTKGKTKSTAARTAGKRSTSAKAKKPSAKRKYSPVASEYVEEEMKEMKQGKLKSGRSGKTVHNPKQGHCNWTFGGAQGGRKGSEETTGQGRLIFSDARGERPEARIVNAGQYFIRLFAFCDGGGAGALSGCCRKSRRCRSSRRWCRRKSSQSCWNRMMRWSFHSRCRGPCWPKHFLSRLPILPIRSWRECCSCGRSR